MSPNHCTGSSGSLLRIFVLGKLSGRALIHGEFMTFSMTLKSEDGKDRRSITPVAALFQVQSGLTAVTSAVTPRGAQWAAGLWAAPLLPAMALPHASMLTRRCLRLLTPQPVFLSSLPGWDCRQPTGERAAKRRRRKDGEGRSLPASSWEERYGSGRCVLRVVGEHLGMEGCR